MTVEGNVRGHLNAPAMPVLTPALRHAAQRVADAAVWPALRYGAISVLVPAALIAAAAMLAEPARQDLAAALDRRVANLALLPAAQDVVTLDSAHTLSDMFAEHDFRLDLVREGWAPVPRLFFSSLPADIAEIDEAETRKALFVQTALPLVLLVNESIVADRARLTQLRDRIGKGLAQSDVDAAWLRDLARRYRGKAANLDDLLQRVDVIPPSLAIAQGAAESGWGTSRPAREDNALFGEMTWRGRWLGQGGDGQSGAYIVRPFDRLFDCVRAYAANLNSHPAYADFRSQRGAMRKRGETPDGYRLATTLVLYSERGWDYIAEVRRIIRVNRFGDFDAAWLDGQSSARLIVPLS